MNQNALQELRVNEEDPSEIREYNICMMSYRRCQSADVQSYKLAITADIRCLNDNSVVKIIFIVIGRGISC